MFFILFLVLVVCEYYLYSRQHYRLCLTAGSLFFLWYDWSTSTSIFPLVHEPIVVANKHFVEPIALHDQPPPPPSILHHTALQAVSLLTTPPLLSNQTNITSHHLKLIRQQKNSIVVNLHRSKFDLVSTWQQRMNRSSLWDDIDYTSGCAARAANWPARGHLERLEIMAAYWHESPNTPKLLDQIHAGLDYWFSHDFQQQDCFMNGGQAHKNCPCGTPGLWQTNWYSQVIAVPRFIGNICLLINETLSTWQRQQCIKFTQRSYATVQQHGGTNLLDVVFNGISWALLSDQPIWLQDGLTRACDDMVIAPYGMDGIQADGAYMYHDRQLYTGNYGDTYLGDWVTFLDMMFSARDAWAPPDKTWTSLITLATAMEWMMVAHPPHHQPPTVVSPWLWQYSVLGRMISFHTKDGQNSAGVVMNVTQLAAVFQEWHNPNSSATNSTPPTISHTPITTMVHRLKRPYTSANQGSLTGTRSFWLADYLVHRGLGYVVTLKLLSSRTTTSECINNQNRLGQYLNDGSLFTYRQGNEYMDVFGAWQWHRVPGVTMDASVPMPTSSDCRSSPRLHGKQDFVGAAVLEREQLGVAVMNYTDPRPGSNLAYQKTYFFFPSLYAVDIDILTQLDNSTDTLPVVTTLDQRRHGRGDTWVNQRLLHPSQQTTQHGNVTSLWHDRALYLFETPVALTLAIGPQPSDWQRIGISNDDTPVDLWLASIQHDHSLTYTVRPNLPHAPSPGAPPASPLTFIRMQGVRGALSKEHRALALAFWEPASISVPWDHSDEGDDGTDVFIETAHPVTLLLQQQSASGSWILAVSDPSQSLTSTTVRVSVDQEESMQDLAIEFPQDTHLGTVVLNELQNEP
ncbi:galactose mutarotase-like protein [Hesseltinella vesiculosa]|uniref:Galactose mutarotase-like protein n=1 Tax=Hesseltinella vesiculosa TaxID=101127 RepID=A0A1X2GVM2_9FUNG|nr:galactose mutarotase-like protein [Hesseltinella vesiculosa]